MSSWRLSMNKCSSGVQTLDSLRQRLKTEAMLCDEATEQYEVRDSLFPCDEVCLEIDGPRATEPSDDICQQVQLPVPPPEDVLSPPPAPVKQPKRRTKKAAEKKPKAVEKLCEDDDRDNKNGEKEPTEEAQRSVSDVETSPKVEEELQNQDVASGGAAAGDDELDELGESDLDLAFAAILADFKHLTGRVKALSSVLTDVQASGVRRSFAGLSKALTEAAAIAAGGSKVPVAPRKKKAAAGKK
ncbi:late transcription factor VLTF-4 [Bovine papular stomatitis virus]|uniref:Late transcription factor VLTF-4 n=1 Tax=Bovine papular stomatitis virus TaxID=129727 RepID=A0A0E3T722_9POXV|nr:late transcription factor VLTF-4 [Bovine papular stomatitis virus]